MQPTIGGFLMPSWGSAPGRDVNQPRRWNREYQVYYRDPVTRKFVPIKETRVKLTDDLTAVKLSDGIPTLSYYGVKLWRK
jgi:hypothetical protein